MLRIEIVKRCTRSDGSVIWKTEQAGRSFALHDLTHFAAENRSPLSARFLGLIAEGCDVENTTGKGKRGALPAEATEVEAMVGVFDSERACGQLWTADEFNTFALRALTS